MPVNVSEVISAAAQLVGREDLASAIRGTQANDEIDLLVKCFNLVESDIALCCLPLKLRESFSPAEGKVAFSAFAKPPIDILSVTLPSGMGIPFELFPDEIQVSEDARSILVTYAYAPFEKEKNGECELPERFTLHTLALGVAAEFLLAHGLYAEAERFEERYREALPPAKEQRGKKLCLRARRWV